MDHGKTNERSRPYNACMSYSGCKNPDYRLFYQILKNNGIFHFSFIDFHEVDPLELQLPLFYPTRLLPKTANFKKIIDPRN